MEAPDDKTISWDIYFAGIAAKVAERSTCLRRKVGVVLVKDRRMLATGYNGAPSGLAHCSEVGCLRQKLNVPSGQRHELCRAVHAEQNAIIQAAKFGVPIEGATLYSTTFPCLICTKMLINCGISRVVCTGGYDDAQSILMLDEAGIPVLFMERDEEPPLQ